MMQQGLLFCLNMFSVMFLKMSLIMGHLIFIASAINTFISQDEEAVCKFRQAKFVMSNEETFTC